MLKTSSINEDQGYPPLTSKFKGLSLINNRVYGLSSDQLALKKQRIKRRYAATWRLSIQENTQNFLALVKFQARLTKLSKSLQELEINFFAGIARKSFKFLCQYFKEFIMLKNLNLSISSNFTHKKIYHLTEGLKRFSSLQSLKLRFAQWDHVTDKMFNILRKGLRRHISLIHLSLSFSQCKKITALTVRNLCKDLKNLTFLQSLSLCFSTCDMIKDEGLQDMKKLLKKVKSLCMIFLDFEYCAGISLYAMEQITQETETFNSSQRMKIDIFSSTYEIMLHCLGSRGSILLQITNWLHDVRAEFKRLGNVLRGMTTLQDISFYFHSFCSMNCSEWKDMSGVLEGLISLQRISFTFSSDSKTTEKGLENMSQSFTQLTSLRKIGLGFFCDEKMSDLEIQNFVRSLKNLVALEEASLFFDAGCKITKTEEQDKIINALKSHTSLQKGTVNFGDGVIIIEVTKG